jgi:hypothetical protein
MLERGIAVGFVDFKENVNVVAGAEGVAGPEGPGRVAPDCVTEDAGGTPAEDAEDAEDADDAGGAWRTW